MVILNDIAHNAIYIAINPLKVRFNDAIEATRLYVSLKNDDLYSKATFNYSLRNEESKILYSGTVDIIGNDYATWIGDNQTPFSYVKTKLSL